MERLISRLLGGLALLVLRNYQKLSLEWVRIRGAIVYVEGVRVARSGFLVILWLGLCLVLGGSGLVMFHVGLFLLLPHDWRAAALMGMGAIYMIAALLVIRWLSAEKTWMECSQAKRIVEAATRRGPGPAA